MIVTHIFLLVGCSFPVIANFIVLSGGFQNKVFLIFSYSGLAFLGVGDTVAAIMGKTSGTTKWRSVSSKTITGSMFLVLGLCFAYGGIIQMVYPTLYNDSFEILISIVIVGLVEGLTMQIDNLICPILFYSCLTQLHAFFTL
jgi:dolichol kinase